MEWSDGSNAGWSRGCWQKGAGGADGLICSLLPEIRRQARRYALQSDVEDVVQMVCEKLLSGGRD